jgi:hypothetical protein
LVVIVRLIVFVAIGPVLRRVGAAYGFDITYRTQELTTLGGDVGLWYFKVAPKSGGEPILAIDYLRGNISVVELLKGRLLVRRAEADGVDLRLERNADGHIPLLDQFLAAAATPTSASVTSATPAKPFQIDFTSPLSIQAFRLQHVRAKIRDAAVKPEFLATVAMDVRVTDLGLKDLPVQFDVDVWSDPILDSLRISGVATNAGKNLTADARVFMRGLHLKPLAGYFQTVGIRPVADDLGADAKATLKTEAAAAPSTGVKATLALEGMSLTADEEHVASLATLRVEADSVDPSGAKINLILLEGGRAEGTRTNQGLIRLAGLELAGSGAPKASPPPSTSPAPALAPALISRPSPYSLIVQDIQFRDMAATFRDFAITPANNLGIVLNELSTKGQALNPNDPQSRVPIVATLSAPGIAQSIRLDGAIKPFGNEKSLEMGFNVDGIRPDALQPYLSAAGIESLLKSAHAEGRLVAGVRFPGPVGDLRLTGLKLAEGADLIVMQDVNIHGAGIDPATGRLKVETIELTGPAVDVAADASDRLIAAGFRWSPTNAALSKNAAAPSTAPSQFAMPELPRVEIGRFAWQGARLHLRDEHLNPPATIAIDDAGIEVKDLVIDLASREPSKPGSIRAWLAAPELARQLTLDGTVTYAPNSFSTTLALRGQGLQASALAPYVKPFGIEPTIRDGSFQLDAKATLAARENQIALTLGLTDVRLSDSGQEKGGLDALQIDEVVLSSGNIDVKSLHITKPRAQLARDTDGVLEALGVRLLPPVPTTRPASPALAKPMQLLPLPLPPIVASIHEFTVEGAQLGWTDRALTSPVQTVGHAEVHLTNLTVGKTAPPGAFQVVLSADGILDQMTIRGLVDPSSESPNFAATIEARGIKPGAAAAYLPPGVELSTNDGRLKAAIEASLAQNPQGGQSAKLTVSYVDWRDGEGTGTPLFAMESMRAIASRVDLPANVIAFDEISVAGLQSEGQLVAGGAFNAAGFTLRPPKPPMEVAATSPSAPPSTAPAPFAAQDVGRMVADARKPLPLMSLVKLDINFRRVAVKDVTRPDSAPLALEDFRLRNLAPILLGGADPESQAPAQLQLTGHVTPIIGAFDIKATTAPLLSDSSLAVDVAVSGIRGDGLTELLPELKSHLNGGSLVDGRFKTHVEAHAKFERRGPRDIDFSRPFQLDLGITGTEFRADESGPVLAGVEAFHAEQTRIEPRTGSVMARLIEIGTPQARLWREADGLHALGLVIPLPKAATTMPSESATPQTAPPAQASAPAAKPGSEIRVDHLILSGLDFEYQDRAVTPPFDLPLNNLEIEARDLTTRMLTEPRFARFSVLVSAGKVSLPVRQNNGSAVAGAIGRLTNLAGATKVEPTSRPMERRELFSQIAVTGRLALYPKPLGYVKTLIGGMELAELEGLANEAGVKLYDGAFDSDVDVRFTDDGYLHLKLRPVATNLDVSEPPNGPISRYLNFSAPVEVVVKSLENTDGSIVVPLNVSLEEGRYSFNDVRLEVAKALGFVVTKSLASAPAKAANQVTELVGLGSIFGKKKVDLPPPVEIHFAPGSTSIPPDA